MIRFAKRFGFSGYTEMQKIFRDGIAQQIAPSRNYQVRIRRVIEQAQGQLSSADIADEFIGGSIAGMQELKRDLHSTVFDDAVSLLVATPSIWVVGCRRSFAVASYLTYALQHTDKRVELLSGLGGMYEGHLRGVRAGDVMVVVSYTPYAQESLECARVAGCGRKAQAGLAFRSGGSLGESADTLPSRFPEAVRRSGARSPSHRGTRVQ